MQPLFDLKLGRSQCQNGRTQLLETYWLSNGNNIKLENCL